MFLHHIKNKVYNKNESNRINYKKWRIFFVFSPQNRKYIPRLKKGN